MAIEIDLATQVLTFDQADGPSVVFPVSTAKAGPGEFAGSQCTPRGRHTVRAKIGAGCVPGTVFVGRRPTGEVFSDALAGAYPDRDFILSRILWLCGQDVGINRGGKVDTFRRFIYIHGSPGPMGVPLSHGCIRMRCEDVIALFDLVTPGEPVLIR